MAHELAHQWFGNLVTMAWWDDLWLNEAFATWMAAKIVDQDAPELGAGRELLTRRLAVMQNDSLLSARKIRQPVRSTSEALEAFDGITYVKGASVLGMVEHWLGEPTFQQGVRAYLAKHAWKNATSQDLFSALEAASGKNVTARDEQLHRSDRRSPDQRALGLLRAEHTATKLERASGNRSTACSDRRCRPRPSTGRFRFASPRAAPAPLGTSARCSDGPSAEPGARSALPELGFRQRRRGRLLPQRAR